jgi:hypothetical protein
VNTISGARLQDVTFAAMIARAAAPSPLAAGAEPGDGGGASGGEEDSNDSSGGEHACSSLSEEGWPSPWASGGSVG